MLIHVCGSPEIYHPLCALLEGPNLNEYDHALQINSVNAIGRLFRLFITRVGPYTYGVYTVFLAGNPLNIRSYVHMWRTYIRFWPTIFITSFCVMHLRVWEKAPPHQPYIMSILWSNPSLIFDSSPTLMPWEKAHQPYITSILWSNPSHIFDSSLTLMPWEKAPTSGPHLTQIQWSSPLRVSKGFECKSSIAHPPLSPDRKLPSFQSRWDTCRFQTTASPPKQWAGSSLWAGACTVTKQ